MSTYPEHHRRAGWSRTRWLVLGAVVVAIAVAVVLVVVYSGGGGAAVTRPSIRRCVAVATSSTARANASSFAREGFVKPLILRTYWSAASATSCSVAGGS